LCKVKDGRDLAVKMEKMINLTATQREEMGRQGREKMMREFDKKIVIQRYLDAIQEVLADKN